MIKSTCRILVYIFVAFLGMSIFSCSDTSIEKEKNFKLAKKERIQGMFEREFELTHDPATGDIPKTRLIKAQSQVQKELSKKDLFELEWDERGPSLVSGRTRGLIFDIRDTTGNTVLAGGVGGGMWRNTSIKSSDTEWEKLGDAFENIAVSALTQNLKRPDIMFFGTGEGYGNLDAQRGLGIWRSMNGGDDWERLESASRLNFEHIFIMVSDTAGNVYAGTDKGMYVTSDDGETWNYLLGENRFANEDLVNDVEIASDNTVFAAVGMRDEDGIYRRNVGDDNFVKLNIDIDPSFYSRIELATAPSNPNVIYALVAGTGGLCLAILRSSNKGASWTEMTVPGARGMGNFARDQAWYDLEVLVDPEDENRVFIGGIDILLTEDGGDTWDQVSSWTGGGGLQYVHADQHRFVMNPINPKEAIFGNDGGVFLCEDITSSRPTISSKINGYNVTQYYAADIHPVDDNYFIGGTQDNGSHLFDQAGMNPGIRLTGGDGAYCHIDQENPNIMITSYVYSNYYISTNGGGNFSSSNNGNVGSFINPTDYDSRSKILYAKYRGGGFLRIDDINFGNTNADEITIDTFNGAGVNAVTVSPNVPNRVYFGLTTDRVAYVDNANGSETQMEGHIISPRLEDGTINCIEIEEGNEDHIVAVFSNYGVESIWETQDGGANWQSIEGNLPDMPIRWALFAPGNPNSLLIATELGVWVTANINGENTEWAPSNFGLANTRIDMLKKNNNGTVLAATHGRGIFTTDSFKDLNVSLIEDVSFYFGPAGLNENCTPGVDTVEIEALISQKVESDVSVAIEAVGTWPEGVNLVTQQLDFLASENTNKKSILILIDKNYGFQENSQITLEIKENPELNLGRIKEHTLVINQYSGDNLDDQTHYRIDTLGQKKTNLIRKGDFGTKVQLIYTADELHAMGLNAGWLTALEFFSYDALPDTAGVMLNMYLGTFRFDDFRPGLPYSRNLGDPIFSDDYSFKLGSNIFTLEEPYLWDGSSNLTVQMCLVDSTKTSQINLLGNSVTSNGFVRSASNSDNLDPCNFFSVSDYFTEQPIITFYGHRAMADTLDLKEYEVNEDAVVYDNNGKWAISELGSTSDPYCSSVIIDRKADSIRYDFIDGPTASKEYILSSTESGSRDVICFFDEFDISDLDTASGELKMIICDTEFSDATIDNCRVVDNSEFDFYHTGAELQVLVSTILEEGEHHITLANGLLTNTDDVEVVDFSLGPIPFSDYLLVEMPYNAKLTVLDINGRVVHVSNHQNAQSRISTSNWSNGLYFVKLESDKGISIKKVIK